MRPPDVTGYAWLVPRRWTSAGYYQVYEASQFAPQVEIITRAKQRPQHAAIVRLAHQIVEATFAGRQPTCHTLPRHSFTR